MRLKRGLARWLGPPRPRIVAPDSRSMLCTDPYDLPVAPPGADAGPALIGAAQLAQHLVAGLFGFRAALLIGTSMPIPITSI